VESKVLVAKELIKPFKILIGTQIRAQPHIATRSDFAGDLDGVFEAILSKSVRCPLAVSVDVLLNLRT
jgi:hypothetical protein